MPDANFDLTSQPHLKLAKNRNEPEVQNHGEQFSWTLPHLPPPAFRGPRAIDNGPHQKAQTNGGKGFPKTTAGESTAAKREIITDDQPAAGGINML